MTQDDLHERLDEMGYGPETNLTNLYYASIPSLGALDEPGQDGPGRLLQLALHLEVDLVVIDTFSRAVAGNENDADTVNRFYNLTGRELKGHGIALLRTDHSGKDVAKGQRGSSAKDGDVDLVFRLVRNDDQISVTRTHSRVTWGVDELKLRKAVSDDGHTIYLSDDRAPTWKAGTAELAHALDDIGLPLDATNREARDAMKEHGLKGSQDVMRDALKYRRDKAVAGVETGLEEGRFTPRFTISSQTSPENRPAAFHDTKEQVSGVVSENVSDRFMGASQSVSAPPPKGGAERRPPRHNLFDDDYDPAA
jgi:hypothetical protein